MTSERAPQPIPAQRRSSPAKTPSSAVERVPTARHGHDSTLPSLWTVGTGARAFTPRLRLVTGPQDKALMKLIIARRWASRPRVLLDHKLRIVRVNQRLCRSFGVLQGSLAGTRLDDWINIDPSVLDRLRDRIGNGSIPWHVILRLHLSGSRVLAVSQILRPLRSRRSGYLLISLASSSERARVTPAQDMSRCD